MHAPHEYHNIHEMSVTGHKLQEHRFTKCVRIAFQSTQLYIYIFERSQTKPQQNKKYGVHKQTNATELERRKGSFFILRNRCKKIAVRAVRRSLSSAYIECKTFENMETTTATTGPPSSTLHESVYQNDDSENNSPDVKSLTAVILA